MGEQMKKIRLIDANAMMKRLKAWDTNDATDKALYNFALNRVLEAPTIEPERKIGKWIDYSDDGYVECPFCGSATNCDNNINELHYCFSCGAKMEV